MKRPAQLALFAVVAALSLAAGFMLSPGLRPGPVDVSAVFAARLPDLSGQPQPIEQWRGKVLVVNFWATWCPPCLEEIPEFVRMQARLGDQGLQFVGIAIDRPDSVAAFARSHRINYPILLGDLAAMHLAKAAGNERGGLPFTLVIDRDGAVLSQHYGGLTEDALLPIVMKALR